MMPSTLPSLLARRLDGDRSEHTQIEELADDTSRGESLTAGDPERFPESKLISLSQFNSSSNVIEDESHNPEFMSSSSSDKKPLKIIYQSDQMIVFDLKDLSCYRFLSFDMASRFSQLSISEPEALTAFSFYPEDPHKNGSRFIAFNPFSTIQANLQSQYLQNFRSSHIQILQGSSSSCSQTDLVPAVSPQSRSRTVCFYCNRFSWTSCSTCWYPLCRLHAQWCMLAFRGMTTLCDSFTCTEQNNALCPHWHVLTHLGPWPNYAISRL